MIVPLEFTGVYTAALFADLVLRRWEKRMLSQSIIDQREMLKEELEENLAILRDVKGLSTEQLAEEQLRIIREFRLRRFRLLTRQAAQHGPDGPSGKHDAGDERAAPDERLSYRTISRRRSSSPVIQADTLSRPDAIRPSRVHAREGR